MKEILAVLLIALQISCSLSSSNPRVKLPLGIVEGQVKTTLKGRQFYGFEGVPYAEAPIGDLRFEAPVPVKPWTGTLQAKNIYKCMQYEHYAEVNTFNKITGDEDCLYLNIYTPDPNPEKKYEVLVYIHGGAFMFGYGALYGPEMILQKDIVLVTLNYRLGPLGFLSTEDDVVPGNNGLRDQTLALKWLKQNIAYFGGNPDSITIYGMSAGGASVEIHYMSPESKGLFHKGISQSGCSLNPWVIVERPLEKARKVAELVGCPSENSRDMVKCLKTKHARQITWTVKSFQAWLYNPFSPFGVVVDSWAKNPVLPEHPLKLLRKGLVEDLPWFTTYVSSEGLYPASDFYHDENIEYIDTNWNKVMPYILHYNEAVPEEKLDEISQRIRQHFFKNEKLSKQNFRVLVKLIGQRLFNFDIETSGRLHSAAVKSPVYSYYYDYRGKYSKSDARTGTDENIGVSHADDTTYILKTPIDTYSTENDRRMSDVMVDMFVSFTKTGIPDTVPDWRPLSKNIADPWVQLHISGPEDLVLEEKSTLSDRKFWESLPFEENERIVSHDEL